MLPKVEIRSETGHGRATKIEVDGVEQHGVTHARVDFDVNDANRLVLTHFVAVTVDMTGEVEHEYRVTVNERHEDRSWVEVVSSTADTVWQALYDCARQLELAARKDGQGVAQAGTIVEPSGRPPGQ